MRRIGLVACSKQKLSETAPAHLFYRGRLFRAASEYAKATCDDWAILSGLYGLVEPDRQITPYDVTLADLPVAERIAWARGVARQLEPLIDGDTAIVLLAGEHYRTPLRSELTRIGFVGSIVEPLSKLGIGEQYRWLMSNLDTPPIAEVA